MNNTAKVEQGTSNNVLTPPEHQVDLPVGEILRRTRVHYNLSLMEVENALRIRSTQLRAIEEGDFSKMPGRVYAIGFVRAYSEYLGLDGDKMVDLFKAQYAAFRNRPSLNFPVTISESKIPKPYIILGSLIAGILFIAFWVMFMMPSYSREQIPVVPEELTKSKLSLLNSAVSNEELANPDKGIEAKIETAESTTTKKPEIAFDKVELVVSQNSWTEIKNSKGVSVFQGILKTGDKYTVPSGDKGKGLLMSTGNAGGITVFIGGKKMGVLGASAKVKRNIPLDAELLRKYIEKL